jgi:acetolactate synthase I/II/III large subunit
VTEPAWLHGGDLVARQIAERGSGHLFTLTGGHISPIYDGLRSTDIRLVDFRHEQAAVHAADASARVRRDVAFVAVTAGPGVTGAVTAVANAYYASSPVVVLGGRNPFMTDGAGNLQEAPQLELMSPITKRAVAVYDGWRICDVLYESVQAAVAPRAGPAYVDLPMDVLLARMDVASAPRLRPAVCPVPALPDPDIVSMVVQELRTATQPVIVAGSGAYWAKAEEALAAFADVADAPVFLNGMARGLLGRGHPFHATRQRRQALQAADFVLLLGADFDFRLGFGQAGTVHPDATIVQVDPDVSRLGRNRHVNIAVGADITGFLIELVKKADAFAPITSRRWTRNVLAKQPSAIGSHGVDGDSSPVDPRQFVVEVAEFLDEDATVIGDGGDIVAGFAGVHRPGGPGLWIDPGPFGCLGVGAPFAIGARLHRPDTQIAVVFGDGSFGFNGFELDSAVRQDLPFVGIVGNDGAWGEMRTFHEDVFGDDDLRGQHLSQSASYSGVAVALGGHGERVDRASQIKPALQRAFDANVPAIVDVVLDPTFRYQNGAVSGRQVAQAYGKGDGDAFKRGGDRT